jgi:multiple sugar transport system permease protein
MKNTFVFTVIRVSVGVFIAILVAILLNRNFLGRKLFRTMIYIPALLPVVGSAIVWRQIFSNDFSLFNFLLGFLGVSPITWMSWDHAMGSILLMSIWCGIGPTMIIIHAALQNVPQSLVESAELDGAGSFAKFRNITLPMISPTILYVVITGIIGALQAFVEMQLLNGNSESTITFTMIVMNNVFSGFGLGYASAMSWIIFIVVGVLTAVFFKVINSTVYYENKVD